MSQRPTPFRIDVSDEVLDDLRRRLAATRFAAATSPGEAGLGPERLVELVEYWQTSYDWREHERRLNSYAQFTVPIDGRLVHFVHVKSATANALPIILTHGWPYTFAEMLPLADELADFDVVIPSLPGYVFSEGTGDATITKATIAETFHELMSGVLGYHSYLTYGEDVGAGVSDWLAVAHPEAVVGIVATHAAFTPDSRRAGESPEETAFFEWFAAKWQNASGYAAIQGTRPDTLAAGLSDSPAGLAAWIIEKLEAWSEMSFDVDDELTTVMLYWVTNSIGTSFRTYYDRDSLPDQPVITVPAGVIVQTGEREYPHAMALRNHGDLRFFEHLPRGGHFTAAEAPGLVAGAIRRLAGTV